MPVRVTSMGSGSDGIRILVRSPIFSPARSAPPVFSAISPGRAGGTPCTNLSGSATAFSGGRYDWPMLGAPPVCTAFLPAGSSSTTGPFTLGATVRTPGYFASSSTTLFGMPCAWRSFGPTRTSTPLAWFAKIPSKVRCSVSVNTNEPAMKAVPSTTDSRVRARRTLCAARLRSATLRIGLPAITITPAPATSSGRVRCPRSDRASRPRCVRRRGRPPGRRTRPRAARA